MNNTNSLQAVYGSMVALITPFNQDQSIDFEQFKKLVEFHLKSGTQGIILGGTTGEGATLNFDELAQLTKLSQEIRQQSNRNNFCIILGMASNATHKAVEDLKKLSQLQPDAVLVLSPYYNKPPLEGIFRHFAELNRLDTPIIIYNCPGRTASNIEADTTLRMARELKNVVAIKEASGNLDQIRQILHQKPADFIVFSGDDAISFELLADGLNGTISVIANQYPAEFQEMFTQFKLGNISQSEEIHQKFLELMNANFTESNPIPVKTYMALQNLIGTAHFRLPLVPAKPETLNILKQIHTNLSS